MVELKAVVISRSMPEQHSPMHDSVEEGTKVNLRSRGSSITTSSLVQSSWQPNTSSGRLWTTQECKPAVWAMHEWGSDSIPSLRPVVRTHEGGVWTTTWAGGEATWVKVSNGLPAWFVDASCKEPRWPPDFINAGPFNAERSLIEPGKRPIHAEPARSEPVGGSDATAGVVEHHCLDQRPPAEMWDAILDVTGKFACALSRQSKACLRNPREPARDCDTTAGVRA